jgi:hypothetical protein
MHQLGKPICTGSSLTYPTPLPQIEASSLLSRNHTLNITQHQLQYTMRTLQPTHYPASIVSPTNNLAPAFAHKCTKQPKELKLRILAHDLVYDGIITGDAL